MEMIVQAERIGDRARVQPAARICLVTGATPDCQWERALPLLDCAGFTRPSSALMHRWIAAAREATAFARPGIAALKPKPLNPALRAATEELYSACGGHVAIPFEDDGPDAIEDFQRREIPGTRLLLLHARPESALVAAMDTGADPFEALARWMESATQALALFRMNRDGVSLADVDCVLAAPGEFLEACRKHFGTRPAGVDNQPRPRAVESAGITHLIAQQIVAQSSEAGRVIAELEVCSLPIGEPSLPVTVDCGLVYHGLREQQARLDDALRSHDQVASALLAVEADLRAQSAALQEARSQLEEVRKENEYLLLQLHQAQETLESICLEKQGLVETGAAQAAECQRLHEQIGALVSARDEQIRRVAQQEQIIADLTVSRDEKAKLAAAVESDLGGKLQANIREKDQILLQLHEVQEKLESAAAEMRKLAEEKSALSAERERLQESIKGLRHERDEQTRLSDERGRRIAELTESINRAEDLLLKLHQVQEELEKKNFSLKSASGRLRKMDKKVQDCERKLRYMENSKSWKITAPMRALIKLLTKRSMEPAAEGAPRNSV